jgi:outer membrane biogenesis lipoprotein LolB
MRLIMNKNVKVLLSAVALAILVAAPAVAKSRTQPHHTASTQAHRHNTDIRDIQTGEMLGTDPDPRVRYELRRDGSSSWEEPAD